MARRERSNKDNVPVMEPITEGLTYQVEEPEQIEGVVDGVDIALNIRENPEVKSNNKIGIAEKGTKIIIVDPKKPVKNDGEEWYKVILNNTPGYAMKKYIKVI